MNQLAPSVIYVHRRRWGTSGMVVLTVCISQEGNTSIIQIRNPAQLSWREMNVAKWETIPTFMLTSRFSGGFVSLFDGPSARP